MSLSEAEGLEWDTALSSEDGRKEYGEVRMVSFVIMSDRLYCAVYTDRGDSRRVISLRKANKREVAYYAEHS
ncbi:hypothetical protein DFP86_106152 [Paludibacterium purpuratum]|uniref:Uncharacterized protein n=1 Tax=Paludibacterium purpuratum TaxID=1144873 RepID=A0A4R7B827_9NEIS|nr:hypothetical protein DFP86_106152 [Paludibacterium purpuratum]